MKRTFALLSALLLVFVAVPVTVYAHEAEIGVNQEQEIEMEPHGPQWWSETIIFAPNSGIPSHINVNIQNPFGDGRLVGTLPRVSLVQLPNGNWEATFAGILQNYLGTPIPCDLEYLLEFELEVEALAEGRIAYARGYGYVASANFEHEFVFEIKLA